MAEMNRSGSFTGTGTTSSYRPRQGFFTVSFGGTGAGTVKIERSRDNSNWFDVSKDQDGNAASYAVNNSEVALDVFQADEKMYWRLNCTAHSSGTIDWVLSQ